MKDDDIHHNMFLRYVIDHPNEMKTGDEIIEEIYSEIYIDDKGEERKRNKVVKPPTRMMCQGCYVRLVASTRLYV